MNESPLMLVNASPELIKHRFIDGSPRKTKMIKQYSITKKPTRISIDSDAYRSKFFASDREDKLNYYTVYKEVPSKNNINISHSNIDRFNSKALKRVQSDFHSYGLKLKNDNSEKSGKVNLKEKQESKENTSQDIGKMLNEMSNCFDIIDTNSNNKKMIGKDVFRYDSLKSNNSFRDTKFNGYSNKISKNHSLIDKPKITSLSAFNNAFKSRLNDSIVLLKGNKEPQKQGYDMAIVKENNSLINNRKRTTTKELLKSKYCGKSSSSVIKDKILKNVLKVRNNDKSNENAYLYNFQNKKQSTPINTKFFSTRQSSYENNKKGFKFLGEHYQQKNRQRPENKLTKEEIQDFINSSKPDFDKKAGSEETAKNKKPKKSALKKNKSNIIKKVTFAEHQNKQHIVSKWLKNSEDNERPYLNLKERYINNKQRNRQVLLKAKLSGSIKTENKIRPNRSDNRIKRTIRLDEFKSIV